MSQDGASSKEDAVVPATRVGNGNARAGSKRKAWWNERIATPASKAYQKYIVELVLRRKPLAPSKDGRHVPLDLAHEKPLIDERRGHPYLSNAITSSRYNIIDFIPKQLFFQFTRLHNFYFICIGVPQTIPGLSTTGNFTTIVPLLVFILATIFKEGYDDWKRHRLDKVENRSLATVLARRGLLSGDAKARAFYWPTFHLPWRKGKSADEPLHEPEHDLDPDFEWSSVQWQNIQVGDIIRLERNDPIPADVVILYASGEHGTAYVETMALDGETSLKGKQAPAATSHCSSITGLRSCSAELAVEDPNRELHGFDGRISVNNVIKPLTLSGVLLRGSILRNTKLAIGVVITTGEETKIRMNANHHPHAKKPRLERNANQIVLTLVIYVVVVSVGCAMGYLMWHNDVERKSWYIRDAPVGFAEIIVGFLIMFNNVIPLALYVSLEITKLGQQFLVTSDVEMYDEVSDEPMRCNTNTILENLGQVSYLLSDKTGTLTENVMKFRKLSIAGAVWRHGASEQDEVGEQARRASHESHKPGTAKPSIEVTEMAIDSDGTRLRPSFPRRSTSRSRVVNERTGEFPTSDLIAHIRSRPDTVFARKARDFILCLALCHTCLPEFSADGSLEFQASSPDELALASAAHELGYSVVSRSSQGITLRITDENGSEKNEEYEILDVIEFTSGRKRMSILLRCPDGKIWLLAKGADSALIPRLRQSELAGRKSREVRRSVEADREVQRRSIQLERRSGLGASPRHSMAIERLRRSLDVRPSFEGSRARSARHEPSPNRLRVPSLDKRHVHGKLAFLDNPAVLDDAEVFSQTFKNLDAFATEGLRTLLFAHKVVSAADYASWKKLYQEATTSLVDRQQRIEDVGNMIEQDLELLGASAIEDKLQKGVPETIEKLRRANIRIWMLTGDKRETAINIAHSARICRPESYVFIFDSANGGLEAQLRSAFVEVLAGNVHTVAVIDGHTLAVVDDDPLLKELFYSLIFQIDSVICCRASPAQKASIVKAIAHYIPKALTLAIGDGANDIAMISAAHVGVGISGKEGLQAARVADYSIAQFRFLQRLLLVHGRWNYVRTAKFILWTFYKEMILYIPQLMVQRHTGYTGTSLYENWSLTALNTLFTSLCVIVPGMYEQDLAANTLLFVPELYVYGQRNRGLNLVKYLMWMLNGAAQGMILWFVPWVLYGKNSVMSDNNMFALGDLVFSIAIVWTNVKLLLIETHHKTRIVAISFAITVAGWWAWNGFLCGAYIDNISPYDVKGAFRNTFGKDPVWWFTFIVAIASLVVLELVLKTTKNVLLDLGYWPPWERDRGGRKWERELEHWQELERDPKFRASLVEEGEMEVLAEFTGTPRVSQHVDDRKADEVVDACIEKLESDRVRVTSAEIRRK